ncbi:CD9 antigen-like isoform X2 [Liolophura sinensis]
MAGCDSCAKYALLICNFIFWISGSAVLSVGIWIRVDPQIEYYFGKFGDLDIPIDYLYTSAYVLMGVGAFVFLVGFCGCCGAVRESARFLGVYILCLVLIVAAEIGVAIYIIVKKGEIESHLLEKLQSGVKNYNASGDAAMDFFQIKFSCCGADNFTEYYYTSWFSEVGQRNNLYTAGSCCVVDDIDKVHPRPVDLEGCMREARVRDSQPQYMYQDGCHGKIVNWVESSSIILIAVGLGVALVEVAGIIFAVCLCRQANHIDYK